ncbi:MAG: YbbR-like domain-containing protein [Candidatus Omnitrophica bacterium]|nr:YbbR-like domain-containing protein [Candidatus Omnitrophota bacterium]
MKIKQLILKNFWLKVTAFFLAVVIWLYVVGELNKGTPEEKALFERVLPYKVAGKQVPVKAAIVGKPRPGYQVFAERVTIKPSACVILAPQGVLKGIQYVTTEDIDISEFTRSVSKEVRIKPIGRAGITVDNHVFVRVLIPIRRIE